MNRPVISAPRCGRRRSMRARQPLNLLNRWGPWAGYMTALCYGDADDGIHRDPKRGLGL